MNQSLRHDTTPSNFPPGIHQRLNMYALAAGAAGVSVLALAQPADAKIVYTPVHVSILGPHGFYAIDLNQDGIVDFNITNTTRFDTDQFFSNLFVQGPRGNAVVGTFVYGGFPPDAGALNAGIQIGPGNHLFQGAAKMVSYYSGGGGQSAHGNWVNVTNRYLGVAFQIDGHTHFGWARFTVKVVNQRFRILAGLTGYAYETVADTPIIAGKMSGPDVEEMPEALSTPGPAPATLGMLAMGSPALEVWRREESPNDSR
jgi:hypothetical protein